MAKFIRDVNSKRSLKLQVCSFSITRLFLQISGKSWIMGERSEKMIALLIYHFNRYD